MTSWLTSEPEDRRLASPPLVLVVCQVRHESAYAASDASRALQVKESLGWATELSETVSQEVGVLMARGVGLSAGPTTTARGWQLASADGDWTATIQPDQFALETRSYPGWADFKSRFVDLISAVETNVEPRLEHRIGLRFINRISHEAVTKPSDWKDFIGEDLFQEQLYLGLNGSLRSAMQALELQADDDLRLVIRHGIQFEEQSQRWTYVLDSDCSRQGTRAFDSKELASNIEKLHRLGLLAFEMATQASLRDYLDGGSR